MHPTSTPDSMRKDEKRTKIELLMATRAHHMAAPEPGVLYRDSGAPAGTLSDPNLSHGTCSQTDGKQPKGEEKKKRPSKTAYWCSTNTAHQSSSHTTTDDEQNNADKRRDADVHQEKGACTQQRPSRNRQPRTPSQHYEYKNAVLSTARPHTGQEACASEWGAHVLHKQGCLHGRHMTGCVVTSPHEMHLGGHTHCVCTSCSTLRWQEWHTSRCAWLQFTQHT